MNADQKLNVDEINMDSVNIKYKEEDVAMVDKIYLDKGNKSYIGKYLSK